MSTRNSLKKDPLSLCILLVDDERSVHQSVGGFLEDQGHSVLSAYGVDEALQLYEAEQVDLVIGDIRMPGRDGLELLDDLKERGDGIEIILITGHADMDTAIEALRRGASDFLLKPFSLAAVVASIERTRRFSILRRERNRYREQLGALYSQEDRRYALVGRSRPMQEVRQLIDKVAANERTTALITGESGTGKELVARAIHRQSRRAGAPLVAVNCTALPETLLENELFGHEKDAFTGAQDTRKGLFEQAEGGTLFLDEIGDISQAAQVKLLRALEERVVRRVGGDREIPIDVRLIAATSRDLEQLVAEGHLREELYYRLAVFRIEVPPLRQRAADVLLLAHYFLEHFTRECGKKLNGIAPEASRLLKEHAFAGNVRELRNLIERAVILCEGKHLRARDLDPLSGRLSPASTEVAADEGPLNLAEVEAATIRRALAKTKGNQSRAARCLGIGRDALRYRLNKYQIE